MRGMSVLIGTAVVLSASPAAATSGFTVPMIVASSNGWTKLILLFLVLAGAASIVIAARKLMSKAGLDGGSATLKALRTIGPMLGLVGALLLGLSNFQAIAVIGRAPPLPLVAPMLAEASVVLIAGLLCGLVAAICNWIVEARVDRALLSVR